MQVQVAVDMIQRQPGGVEPLELRVDFPPQLPAQTAPEEIAESGADGAAAQFPVRVDQAGDLVGRQDGMAAQQGQMQPHPQPGVLAGQGHRFLERGLGHHEAGSRQDAFPMGANNCLVDGTGPPKVVGVDDQAPGLGGRPGALRRHNRANGRPR